MDALIFIAVTPLEMDPGFCAIVPFHSLFYCVSYGENVTPIIVVKAEHYRGIHKCFLCPYKRKSSMLCFIAFSIHEHLWSHGAGKACHREGYITQTTYILRKHVFVLSLFVVCFPIVVNALLHGFNPYIYKVFPALWMFHVLMCSYSSQCNEA